MFVTVTGGSGSGKSEYSENLLLKLDGNGGGNRIYIATMEPFGEESIRRIKRHRAMRRGKGFETAECYTNLKSVAFSDKNGKKPSVLLECMSNLTANELYREDGAGEQAVEEILTGIDMLLSRTENLVVVTNEVFSDGIHYGDSTEYYRKLLGKINRELASRCDAYVEVVYSIPVYYKGGPL